MRSQVKVIKGEGEVGERGLSRAAQFSWRRTAELTMGVYEGIRQRRA